MGPLTQLNANHVCDLSFPPSPEHCTFGTKNGLSCNAVGCVMTSGMCWEIDALNSTDAPAKEAVSWPPCPKGYSHSTPCSSGRFHAGDIKLFVL